MSSESSYAHRAAVFYGPEIAQLSRVGRVDFLRQRIVAIETAEKQRRQQAEDEHKRNCDECRRGGMCLWDLTLDKEEMEVRNRLAFMRSLVHSEERDAEYADRARQHGVDYKQHIDGWCSYWQNLRHRKFVSVEWTCERCGEIGPLECHHRHYDTLGFEELGDLEALCRHCHGGGHR